MPAWLNVTWLEVFGFLTGAANVWLLAQENIWNWPVALVNNLAYLVVFLRAGLYGDAGLQLVYAAFGVYGWAVWLGWSPGWSFARRRAKVGPASAVPRVHLLGRGMLPLAAAMVLAAIALYSILSRFTDSTVPAADAITTSLALAATWAQSRKYLESWWLWIAADLIYIPLYGYKQLWLTSALYAVFLAMCIAGLRRWSRRLESPV